VSNEKSAQKRKTINRVKKQPTEWDKELPIIHLVG
jgi:hypothetical protein